STVLMENAGRAMAAEMEPLYSKKVVVFSGGGNNGGDGLVAARLAVSKNAFSVKVYMPKGASLTHDTAEMKKRFVEYGGTVDEISEIDACVIKECSNADIIVDALFGTGLSREPAGLYARMVDAINGSKAKIFSADLPSGVFTDSGRVSEHTVKADKTITFTLAKPAHFLMPSAEYCGKVAVRPIGIPGEAYINEQTAFESVDEDFLFKTIKKRSLDTHKGSYGKVLLICGSEIYTGAPYFAAEASLRTGSGLIYLCVPEKIHPILASKCSEAIVVPVSGNKEGEISAAAYKEISGYIEKCDAMLIGPGLGRSADTQEFILETVMRANIPAVLDADGINAFCGHIDLLGKRGAPTVLTPHAGEFTRLSGLFANTENASGFAVKNGVTVLLKGHRTIVADRTGKVRINTTGNPGMAKGGSGDVLSGIIVSLIGQGLSAPDAAAAGAYIHGKAGNIAANRYGEYSMTPTDIKNSICEVLKKFNSREW
ncbi:MAG: NAD(P)H-hydrate dehydratase, partial [Bacillota bacterium]|nr:NAD(P)H-hydrate dehydratase [Bacillota bacterium]